MKTENEKFYNARLAGRAKELIEKADAARCDVEKADEVLRLAEKPDSDVDADGLKALFDKKKALAEVWGEAERLAFNAERASYYAERGDLENVAYFTSFDPFDY